MKPCPIHKRNIDEFNRLNKAPVYCANAIINHPDKNGDYDVRNRAIGGFKETIHGYTLINNSSKLMYLVDARNQLEQVHEYVVGDLDYGYTAEQFNDGDITITYRHSFELSDQTKLYEISDTDNDLDKLLKETMNTVIKKEIKYFNEIPWVHYKRQTDEHKNIKLMASFLININLNNEYFFKGQNRDKYIVSSRLLNTMFFIGKEWLVSEIENFIQNNLVSKLANVINSQISPGAVLRTGVFVNDPECRLNVLWTPILGKPNLVPIIRDGGMNEGIHYHIGKAGECKLVYNSIPLADLTNEKLAEYGLYSSEKDCYESQYRKLLHDAKSDISKLNAEISKLTKDLENEKADSKEKINKLTYENDEKIRNFRVKQKEDYIELKYKYDKEINDIKSKHDKEINSLTCKYDKEINGLTYRYDKEINKLNKIVDSYKLEQSLDNLYFKVETIELKSEYNRKIEKHKEDNLYRRGHDGFKALFPFLKLIIG